MARSLFEALATPDPADPWAAEAEAPHPFLAALAREGRVRRAARELAEDEFQEGTWVDEEAEEATAPLRLAAQDHGPAGEVVYAGGPWRVRLHTDAAGARSLVQEAGPVGGTVVLPGDPPAYVPLVPAVAAPLPGAGAAPEALALLDPGGRTVRLTRT